MNNPVEPGATPPPIAPAVSRRFILGARLVLLVAAVFAVGSAAVIVVRGAAPRVTGVLYVCPMHAEARGDSPGQCPICHMALETTAASPVADGAPATPAEGLSDTTALDNARRHQILDFVRERSLLFDSRDLRAPAWVEEDGAISAVFYDDQIAAISAEDGGTFSPTGAPQSAVEVRRAADAPVSWDRSTSRIRFRPAGRREARLEAGQVGWLEVPRKSRPVLAVPVSAIVQSPEGPYVLAAVDAFHFEKRPIRIGETFLKQGFAVVLSGLRANERVVARGSFFFDADRRLGMRAGDPDRAAP